MYTPEEFQKRIKMATEAPWNEIKLYSSKYGKDAVSYTHLDVYKRQIFVCFRKVLIIGGYRTKIFCIWKIFITSWETLGPAILNNIKNCQKYRN